MVELAGGSRVERVVLYGTEQGNDLQHKRRAVVVLLGLVAASACVALLGMVWPSVVPGTETELQSVLQPLPRYVGGSSWASSKLSHLDSTDAGWLGTTSVKLQPLPSYNPNDNSDDEGDDLKDLVDGDFEPSLAQKKMVHSRSSQAHHHENPDVKNLGALSKQVLGKDVESPKEKEKEEQKRIFAKAARTEVRLQKSLDGNADKAKSNKVGTQSQPDSKLSSSLESLSSYRRGKVGKAEAQLAALEKQVHKQEAAIKGKDEKNIQALKMEEQQAKKDELHRLASLKAHEHSMSKLLHSRIEKLKHERAEHRMQAEKAERQEAKLKAKMAAVKDADKQRLARLQKKLDKLGAGKASAPAPSAPGGAKARGSKVMGAGNDDKFVKVKHGKTAEFRAHTQELSEMPGAAGTQKKALAKTAKMDAQANKVAHMLEKSSKLQQIAIRDAANEAKLIQQSFQKYFHQSLAEKDKAPAPAAAVKSERLPLQDGPRAAGFAKHSPEVQHKVKKVEEVHLHYDKPFDSSDEKPRGFSQRLDAPSYFAKAAAPTNKWAALGKRVDSDARAASLESPSLRWLLAYSDYL